MADNPQETVRELRELVVAYAKQEAVDPILGLGKYAAFGVLGSLLIGFGIVCLEIGLLRLLQDEWLASLTNTGWSWVAYLIVIVTAILAAAIVWFTLAKRRKKTSR